MKNSVTSDSFICFLQKQQKLQNLVYALDEPRIEFFFTYMVCRGIENSTILFGIKSEFMALIALDERTQERRSSF